MPKNSGMLHNFWQTACDKAKSWQALALIGEIGKK
jgi:hypothetical protein